MPPPLDVRHEPRLPVRAPATLAFGLGRWRVVAEDFCAGGCGFVSPFPLRRGEAVFLTVELPGAAPLAAHATVAWASRTLPYRTGVAFARAGAEDRQRRLAVLVERDPALAHPPPAVRPDAMLRLAGVPGPGLVLGREERLAVRAARDGWTVRELLEAAPAPGATYRALLMLAAHGLVDGNPGPAPHPAWSPVLAGEAEVLLPAPSVAPNRAGGRPGIAQVFVDVARSERAAGHLTAGVEWLQAAAQAAPGDAEIRAALDAWTVG